MPMILRSTAERLEYAYEGAMIYFHRLTYDEQKAMEQQWTTRGQLDVGAYWREAAMAAVDGWNDQILTADFQAIPIPMEKEGLTAREQIGGIVAYFAPKAVQDIGQQALDNAPEALLKNWPARSNGSSASSTAPRDASLPATIAAPNSEGTDAPSPATAEG